MRKNTIVLFFRVQNRRCHTHVALTLTFPINYFQNRILFFISTPTSTFTSYLDLPIYGRPSPFESNVLPRVVLTFKHDWSQQIRVRNPFKINIQAYRLWGEQYSGRSGLLA